MNQLLLERPTSSGRVLRIVHGDITEEQTEAIVNAANERLAHGGGVAGAIVRRGGQEIQRESSQWVREHGAVPTGSAAITGAGLLPARYVIHAVGPVWGTGDEEAKLASAVRSALQLAAERGIASISLPAISAGIFGFPTERCARVLLETVWSFLQRDLPAGVLTEVHLCLYDTPTAEAFVEAARRTLGRGEEGSPGPSCHLRRRDKAILQRSEWMGIIASQRYMTLALCRDNEPYLVTVNYGFSPQEDRFYFHCAQKGRKIDYLQANPTVWGQVLEDRGYLHGECDHAFRTVQFRGQARLVTDMEEKRRALYLMIEQLESDPEKVKAELLTQSSLERVAIVCVQVEAWSGKQGPAPEE